MSFTKAYRWVTKFKSLNRMLLILVILQLSRYHNLVNNILKKHLKLNADWIPGGGGGGGGAS